VREREREVKKRIKSSEKKAFDNGPCQHRKL
jgi:hypothetical protein